MRRQLAAGRSQYYKSTANPKHLPPSSEAMIGQTDQAVCTSKPVKLGTQNDRCGYGPRLPLVVISPYTRSNYVSNNLTDQSSVVKFIEDNWLHRRQIGGGSYDGIAGSLDSWGGVLDFHTRPNYKPLILNPTTRAVVSKN